MKILIVDDSKAMRMIIARTLKQTSLSVDSIVEASNGVEALEKIASESPDMVFSDWNMPEMKGIDLLKEIRGAGNDIRFGFLTSESSDETKRVALEEGANFLVTKPFTAESIEIALGPILA